jgi:dihydrolipoamide dehydrogenase
VAVVEKDRVGGVCTNVGCIPTKTLLKSVELLSEIKSCHKFGVAVQGVALDFKGLMKRKEEIVNRMVGYVEYLLEKNGVQLIRGSAALTSPRKVRVVEKGEGMLELEAESIIIATGSKPLKPPIPGADWKDVLTSDEALALENAPHSLLIMGGGAVGCEFASLFSGLGTEVRLVEMMSRLLPAEDGEIGSRLEQLLRRRGVEVSVGVEVKRISSSPEGKKVALTSKEGVKEVEAEKVLLATGRVPNVENLGLENAGVSFGRKGIPVNQRMETNVPRVFAVGDVAGGQFAHEAYAGGLVAAENALGGNSILRRETIPRCVFTSPEVAAVGLTEEQARERGHRVEVGRFPFAANGRAVTLEAAEGFVKVVAEAESGELLGVHILGPHASELISGAITAVSLEATVEDVARTVIPHPTLSEAFKEAVLDCQKRAIHSLRRTLS